MPVRIFTNNAVGELNAPCLSTDVSLVLKPGQGGSFPSPTGGDFFTATLQNGIVSEVVNVTARSGDVLTIVRAREGTTAATFAADTTTVELRVTAGGLNDFLQELTADTFDGIGVIALDPTDGFSGGRWNGGTFTGLDLRVGAVKPADGNTTNQIVLPNGGGRPTINDNNIATDAEVVTLVNSLVPTLIAPTTAAVAALDAEKADLAGATFTGPVVLAGNAVTSDQAVPLGQAQGLGGLVFSSAVTLLATNTVIVVVAPGPHFEVDYRLDTSSGSVLPPAVEFSTDGGATYVSTGGQGAVYSHDLGVGAVGGTLAGLGLVQLTVPSRIAGGTTAQVWGTLRVSNVTGATKQFTAHGGWTVNGGANMGLAHAAMQHSATAAITHLRFSAGGDTLAIGSYVRVYNKRTT